jgi:hypothetical protein
VYLDGAYTFQEYIKQNVTFINYVRERFDAQVHVLITQQQTGSGGDAYNLFFLGQNAFAGKNDTLMYIANTTNTDDETRKGLVKTLITGLLPYIAKTTQDLPVSFSYNTVTNNDESRQADDTWNGWVYSVGTNGNMSLSSSVQSYFFSGQLSAKKVTDNWKIGMGGGGYLNKSIFDLGGADFTSQNDGSYGNIAVVKSLSKRWSAGVAVDYISSTFSNYDVNLTLSPAVEYNIFPYAESTTKLLTFFYTIGPEYSNYTDTTIFYETEEILLNQELDITLSVNQKWGSIDLGVNGSAYLHDLGKNQVGIYTSVSWSILAGLSLSTYLNFDIIRNQLNLPKEGASEEEILLQLQELQTDFQFFTYFGVSYTFGSIYNNIVNPRFRAGTFSF